MDQHASTKETAAETRVSATRLTAFVTRAFIAAGLPEDDAQAVAGLMVEADLRGSDTHGVIRLPLYMRRLRAGGINIKPNIRVISDRASVALIDGDNGMGAVVGEKVTRAIDRAINHKDTWNHQIPPPIEQIVSRLVAEESTKSLETIRGTTLSARRLLG